MLWTCYHQKTDFADAPPNAASALSDNANLRNTLVKRVNSLFGLTDSDQVSVYPDDSWHRVVINHVPAMDPTRPSKSDEDILDEIAVEWREYNRLAHEIPQTAFARSRLLIPKGTKLSSLRTVSICIPIPDIKQARRLLSEGAFFFGEYCKVSVYSPRRR